MEDGCVIRQQNVLLNTQIDVIRVGRDMPKSVIQVRVHILWLLLRKEL